MITKRFYYRTFSGMLYSVIFAYLVVSLGGLFGAHSPSLWEVFRSTAFVSFSVVALAIELLYLVFVIVVDVRGSHFLERLIHAGLSLFFLGICISYLVRYEGSFVLAEGQVFEASPSAYAENASYLSRFASLPAHRLYNLNELKPTFSSNGFILRSVTAGLSVEDPNSNKRRGVRIHNIVPYFEDAFTFFQVVDFGYAPRYRLVDNISTLVTDEAYVFMKIATPGMEDSFRLPTLPYTFYVRYFEEPQLIRDPEFKNAEMKESVLGVRVSRNIILQYKGYLKIGEKANIGLYSVSFEDVRKWVKIRVVRDFGLWPMITGAIMTSVGMIITFWKKF